MGIKAIPAAIGRAFAATPGTPADRLAILKEAIAKALRDPELLAEGNKAKIDFQHISAEQVLKDFTVLFNQTPETLNEMGKYIKAEG
jgi:tripartite-type tricarboxylate transporter receptor subunit TctC